MPQPLSTDILVACPPCQPYSRMTSPKTCKTHAQAYLSIGDNENEANMKNLVTSLLPLALLVEEVEGFDRSYPDLDGKKAVDVFTEIMYSAKRPDGTTHFNKHCTIKLDAKMWAEENRPRTSMGIQLSRPWTVH